MWQLVIVVLPYASKQSRLFIELRVVALQVWQPHQMSVCLHLSRESCSSSVCNSAKAQKTLAVVHSTDSVKVALFSTLSFAISYALQSLHGLYTITIFQ